MKKYFFSSIMRCGEKIYFLKFGQFTSIYNPKHLRIVNNLMDWVFDIVTKCKKNYHKIHEKK